MNTIHLGSGRLFINGVDCGEVQNITINRETETTTWQRPPGHPSEHSPYDVPRILKGKVALRYGIDLAALEEFLGCEIVWPYSPARVVESLEEWLKANTTLPRAELASPVDHYKPPRRRMKYGD